jgi:hypothetical protein
MDTETAVWFAFQDPKSGREYFHGPGGETSWVLPTTTRPENTIQRSSMEDGEAPNDGDDVRGRSKPADATCRLKRSRIWSSIGIAIVVILIFNTLFLLVLVRVMIDDNDGKEHASSAGGEHVGAHEKMVSILDLSNVGEKVVVLEADPTHAVDSSPLPSNAIPELGNGSHCNSEIRDMAATADDPFIPTMGPVVPLVDSFSPEDAIGAEVVTNGERKQIASKDVLDEKRPAHEEIEHQEELNEGDAGEQTIYINKKATHVREPGVPPMKCWIPFSYILVGKCRQHARKGLLMPLADAESLPLI